MTRGETNFSKPSEFAEASSLRRCASVTLEIVSCASDCDKTSLRDAICSSAGNNRRRGTARLMREWGRPAASRLRNRYWFNWLCSLMRERDRGSCTIKGCTAETGNRDNTSGGVLLGADQRNGRDGSGEGNFWIFTLLAFLAVLMSSG